MVHPTGHYGVDDGAYIEYLSKLNTAEYDHPDVVRYLRGVIVFFSTSSPHN